VTFRDGLSALSRLLGSARSHCQISFFISRTNKRVRTQFTPSQTDASGNESWVRRRKIFRTASWAILGRPVTSRRFLLFCRIAELRRYPCIIVTDSGVEHEQVTQHYAAMDAAARGARGRRGAETSQWSWGCRLDLVRHSKACVGFCSAIVAADAHRPAALSHIIDQVCSINRASAHILTRLQHLVWSRQARLVRIAVHEHGAHPVVYQCPWVSSGPGSCRAAR
jgi:hypothetical protein